MKSIKLNPGFWFSQTAVYQWPTGKIVRLANPENPELPLFELTHTIIPPLQFHLERRYPVAGGPRQWEPVLHLSNSLAAYFQDCYLSALSKRPPESYNTDPHLREFPLISSLLTNFANEHFNCWIPDSAFEIDPAGPDDLQWLLDQTAMMFTEIYGLDINNTNLVRMMLISMFNSTVLTRDLKYLMNEQVDSHRRNFGLNLFSDSPITYQELVCVNTYFPKLTRQLMFYLFGRMYYQFQKIRMFRNTPGAVIHRLHAIQRENHPWSGQFDPKSRYSWITWHQMDCNVPGHMFEDRERYHTNLNMTRAAAFHLRCAMSWYDPLGFENADSLAEFWRNTSRPLTVSRVFPGIWCEATTRSEILKGRLLLNNRVNGRRVNYEDIYKLIYDQLILNPDAVPADYKENQKLLVHTLPSTRN